MKGYIYVYDQRSAYLKELFLENGVEIVDSIEDEADFYFVKDQKLSRKNVFSLVSLNRNVFIGKSKKRYAFYFNFRLW